MPNPFDQVMKGYQDAQDASKSDKCPNCGHPVATQDAGKDDEPLSKKIKRGLGLPDDGAAF